jgi:hypothetical protein
MSDPTVLTLPSKPFKLSHGAHGSEFTGCACASELVSLLTGNPFSFEGVTVSGYVNRMMIALNDRMDDAELSRLLPLLPRAIGTEDDGHEDERLELYRDFLLRRRRHGCWSYKTRMTEAL